MTSTKGNYDGHSSRTMNDSFHRIRILMCGAIKASEDCDAITANDCTVLNSGGKAG